MICKNCGTQLEEGSKFCAECGTSVDSLQESVSTTVGVSEPVDNPVVSEPVSEINQSVEPVNPAFSSVESNVDMSSSNDIEEKPKKNLLIPVIVLLVLVLAVGAVYYYFNNKKKVVKDLINNAYEKFDGLTFNNSVNLDQSVLISGDFSINTNIPELKDLNSEKINYILGVDYSNKKMELGASLEENGLKIIDAAMYMLDNNAYISLKDDFDKLIKVPVDEMEDVFTTSSSMNLSEEDIKYVVKAYKDILIDSIDSNDLVKSTATITLDGKDTKVTKLTYDMTSQRAAKLVNNIIDGTLNDSKLLDILSNATGTSVEDIKSELSSSKITDTSSSSERVTFDIYTKGFNNSFVGMDINGIIQIRKNSDNVTIEAGLGSEKISLVIKSMDDNSCVIELNSSIGGEVIKGSLSITTSEVEKNVIEGSIIFDLNYNGTTFSATSKFNEKIGASIADIDVSNAVDAESLSDADLNKIEQTLSTKFMNSKLYKLIENFSSSSSYSSDYNYSFDNTGLGL